MIDFFVYRILPLLFALLIVLLLIPWTSVRIIHFVTDLYYQF